MSNEKRPLAQTALATRMQNTDIGIYLDSRSPSWPIEDKYVRIHFGFAEPSRQLNYILSNPDTDFELVVRGKEAEWQQHVNEFAGIPNLRGLGGSSLPLATFQLWPHLTYAFLGDDCPDFTADHFPQLKSLRGAFFPNHDRGIAGHQSLQSIYAAYDPRQKCYLGNLGDLPKLRHLAVSYGGVEDLGFTEGARKLEVLNLSGATRLRSLSGIAELQDLQFLWLDGARKLEDVSELLKLRNLRKVIFDSYNKASLDLSDLKDHFDASGVEFIS